jgi:FtsP/CotA-like multicopper oxidase with cupredoxin domain
MSGRKGRRVGAVSILGDGERPGLSRRGFLLTGAAAAAFPATTFVAVAQDGGHSHGGQHHPEGETGPVAGPPRVPFTEGEPLVEPEMRQAVDGILETTLRTKYAYRDVGGYRLFMRTYEGGAPGPTLRMSPGDTLKIKLINDLPPNREAAPAYMDQPHQLNATNFHFHGGHVSPSGISDNVLRSMWPGGSYDIEIALPEDHPAGTYWYHPHRHGGADIQIASGMAGVIVIEGDFDKVPEIAAARDRVMVLSEVVFDAWGMVETFDVVFSETAARFLTLNGQRAPTIDMRPGEVQRWRILCANYQDDSYLSLEGHEFVQIARDGIALGTLDQARLPLSSPDREQPGAMLIAPGQRIDVLVKAGEPGTYELRALPYNQGYESPQGLIARVVISGEPLPMNLPAAIPQAPLETIRDEEITGSRTLTFSAIRPEVDAAGHWQEFSFLIDGKVFDAERVDQRVALGAVEEWTVVNEFQDDHIFHIHVNPFQVVKVNGEPVEPSWQDTAVLPRGGSLTFRSRFLDFTGKFVLHCHMMNHEELGMMQVVEVYPP